MWRGRQVHSVGREGRTGPTSPVSPLSMCNRTCYCKAPAHFDRWTGRDVFSGQLVGRNQSHLPFVNFLSNPLWAAERTDFASQLALLSQQQLALRPELLRSIA